MKNITQDELNKHFAYMAALHTLNEDIERKPEPEPDGVIKCENGVFYGFLLILFFGGICEIIAEFF